MGFAKEWLIIPFVGLGAAALLAFLPLTPYMWAATLAYSLQVAGFLLRKRFRMAHVRLMAAGMLLDLSLVLILEAKRDAIATALTFDLTPLQQAHIAVSTLAVLHYLPITILGYSRLKNPASPDSYRSWHRRLGISAFVLRSLGFLLMFSMIGLHR
jgi:hypothetical protein